MVSDMCNKIFAMRLLSRVSIAKILSIDMINSGAQEYKITAKHVQQINTEIMIIIHIHNVMTHLKI